MLLSIMFYRSEKFTGQDCHYNQTHSALCVWPLSHIMYDTQSAYFHGVDHKT